MAWSYSVVSRLVGCSSDSGEHAQPAPLKLFDTRDQAIQEYIRSEPMSSWTIIELRVDHGPKLLITKRSEEVYAAAQIVEKNKKVSVAKLSGDFDLTVGSGFKGEYTTLDGKTYTVSVSKEKDAQGTLIKELGATVTVQEGHHLGDMQGTVPVNAIQSYEPYGLN
ncbi:hypothetical protein D3C73_410470 [compost metagenome]